MNRSKNKTVFILLFTLFVLLASTFAAWWITKSIVNQRTNEVFLSQATTVESWIVNRLEQYRTILYGLQGFWAGSNEVTPESWNNYIELLKIDERFEGITSISYARGENGNYLVTYVYPLDRSSAINFDITSEQSRFTAINNAIEKDSIGFSDRIMLAADDSPGFIMVAPLYSTIDIPSSLEERRNSVESVALIAFKSDNIFKDVFTEPDPFPGLDIELYRGEVLEENHLLYDHDKTNFIRKGNDQNNLETKRTVHINGEVFSVLVASKPSFRLSKTERNLPNFILVMGTVTSLLIFGYFYKGLRQQISR